MEINNENADPSGEENEVDKKKIEKLLKNISKMDAPKIRKKAKPKTDEQRKLMGKAIHSLLQEWLDCYVIIGYDTVGQEFIKVTSNSQLDNRAIGALLQEFYDVFFDMLNPEDNSFGPPEIDDE